MLLYFQNYFTVIFVGRYMSNSVANYLRLVWHAPPFFRNEGRPMCPINESTYLIVVFDQFGN